MFLHEQIPILGNKFQLYFIENEGMAFGMSYGGETGKLILSLFRIAAVTFITYYLIRLIKKPETKKGLVISLALILAGAFGNIVDSVFYGVIFNESAYHLRNVAEFMPDGGGYAAILHGKVVDMLYFPLFEFELGGRTFKFFEPIFNLADSAITAGVIMILVWHRRYFPKKQEQAEVPPKEDSPDGQKIGPDLPQ